MKRQVWTPEEVVTLHRMRCVEGADYPVIAAALNRSAISIKSKLSACKWSLSPEATRALRQRQLDARTARKRADAPADASPGEHAEQ